MMSEDKNQDYLQKMIDEITKYEKCLDKFESWFKWVSYDEVKNQDWYKDIENDVIKHLNNEFVTRGYDKFQENKLDYSSLFSAYDELQKLCIQEISRQQDIFFSYHVDENQFDQFKKKYASNIDYIKKNLFPNIDFTKQDWSKSEDFKQKSFDVIKQFESFKSKAKEDFFSKAGLLTSSRPSVKFQNLITSPNFIAKLKAYFDLDNEKRKTHELKKIFSYTHSNRIIVYHEYGQCSFEYGFIQAQQTISNNDRLLIFYSLVEFWGKDFFDRLFEKEKDMIRGFYKNNPKFKLSDPSILENTADKNEQNKILTKNNNTQAKSKKTKKGYTKSRVGIVVLGVFFAISLILAWQVNIYILIASAILLAILIIYLIELKKNGFECTKIFCFCMSVENEPKRENSRDNDLSNPKSDGNKMHIKS